MSWTELTTQQTTSPWKDGGIYLIVGGGGGLGWIFAKEIAKHTKNTTLILTGRSSRTQLPEIDGAKVLYRQVDVTKKELVESLIHEIQQKQGQLNGVIHSAGITQDHLIIQKDREEFLDVLSSKVLGTINLDQSTRDIPLDLFLLFSSGTAAVGNVGQADYAMANAFMNAFADYRITKKRSGQTLSVMWPLWKEGDASL